MNRSVPIFRSNGLCRPPLIAMALLTHLGAGVGADVPAERPPIQAVTLENAKARLTVLPALGGRAVDYRLQGRENALLSDPASWADAAAVPLPAADAPWRPFNGHIVWLSPQKDFWNQQTVDPKRVGTEWPPDPWLTYGVFEIVEHTRNRLRLVGPDSPVSGVRMTKAYELREDGGVDLEVSIVNIRPEPVSWAIWSNTHVAPTLRVYVPLGEHTYLWLAEFRPRRPAHELPLAYAVSNGWFSVCVAALPEGIVRQHGKAFLTDPRRGCVAAFTRDSLYVKAMAVTPTVALPPKHGFIEVYLSRTRDGEGRLELEMHGPYVRLKPGETATLRESWRLHPYDGPDEPAAHTDLLDGLFPSQK